MHGNKDGDLFCRNGRSSIMRVCAVIGVYMKIRVMNEGHARFLKPFEHLGDIAFQHIRLRMNQRIERKDQTETALYRMQRQPVVLHEAGMRRPEKTIHKPCALGRQIPRRHRTAGAYQKLAIADVNGDRYSIPSESNTGVSASSDEKMSFISRAATRRADLLPKVSVSIQQSIATSGRLRSLADFKWSPARMPIAGIIWKRLMNTILRTEVRDGLSRFGSVIPPQAKRSVLTKPLRQRTEPCDDSLSTAFCQSLAALTCFRNSRILLALIPRGRVDIAKRFAPSLAMTRKIAEISSRARSASGSSRVISKSVG